MKAIERFYKYLDFKGIKPTRFEKDSGLSNGYLGTQLRRKGSLGEDILNTIIDNCLDLSPLWLLTGKGSMIKVDDNLVNEPAETYANKNMIDQEMFIQLLIENNKLKGELISKLKKEKEPPNISQHLASPAPKLEKD